MNLKQIEKKIDEFNLPVFPQMLVQVRKVSSDEYSSAQDLAEIILKDQALTLKILSIANSAFYGFYGKVSTITQAIIVLGFEAVKNITFGITAYNNLSAFAKESVIKQFWEHSLATGVCSELIAEKMGYATSEEALVAGLLHDVGKILLVHLFPEQYREVEMVMSEHGAYSDVVESSILGVNHCMVGEIMAKKWGLPSALVNAIRDHHKKAWGASMLTDIVSYSDLIIEALTGNSESEKIDSLIKMGSTELDLKLESIKVVMSVLAERLEEYSNIFEIRVESLLAYTTMIEEEYAKLKKSTASRIISKKEEEMSILMEISNAMVQGRPEEEMLQMVLEGIIRIAKAELAILFTLDLEQSVVKGKTALGKNAMRLCSTFSMSLTDDTSVIVNAINSGDIQFVNMPADSQASSSPDHEILSELEVVSVCIIPLFMQKKPLGAIMFAWKDHQKERDEEASQRLSLFANQAALILSASGDSGGEKEKKGRKRSTLLLDLD